MRLNHYLSGMVKSELEEIKDKANFTDEELIVFECMAKGKSIVACADKCNCSSSTVSNRVESIKRKMEKIV